ncbi:MAG TPA: response regulator [Noviherbaspirillum sp.]|jgi:DNA-binding NarL/FixJ family response regulator|uniref:response regulator n=1 Tax=Noviherbaspirillum sp. TaxID=1926288 RepID=UPI002DDD1E23|nr:response regulator [Noviherbaspirillum sp.]HEV2610761.1 response regulator [Noviherbaspirillum sp.]
MLRAVVLDNNAISRDLLKSVLANGGYDIVGDANISASSIASMIRLQPQIACIDIGMADEAGFQKLDEIRESLPKAMIFVVSGKLDSRAVQGALQRGVHGFIVKPFNGVTVLATIRNAVIKLARQHRAANSHTGSV